MTDSILDTVKKALGLGPDYTDFDIDIIMHINSVFSTLNQLGIGADAGFMIEDNTAVWDSFLTAEPRLNNVKTYTYLRVQMLFDPPTSVRVLDAKDAMIKELEWRITNWEGATWTDPDPPRSQEHQP